MDLFKRVQLKILRRPVSLAVRQELYRAKITGIFHFRKKTGNRPVFILGDPRTGSSLLVSCLNSNPGAFFGGEILSHFDREGLRHKWISKRAALNHLRNFVNAQNRPVCGAKIFFWHLRMRKISLKDLAKAFPEAKWLVLYRRNRIYIRICAKYFT